MAAKTVRIDTATETNSDRVRLAFRVVTEQDEYELLWKFALENPYASQNYFHSFNVTLASQIAHAMLSQNPQHCGTLLRVYRATLMEDGLTESLDRYNSMNSDWSRLSMLVMDRLQLCRQAKSFGTVDQDILDMTSDLKFYYSTLAPIIVFGMFDQLTLCGVDLRAITAE